MSGEADKLMKQSRVLKPYIVTLSTSVNSGTICRSWRGHAENYDSEILQTNSLYNGVSSTRLVGHWLITRMNCDQSTGEIQTTPHGMGLRPKKGYVINWKGIHKIKGSSLPLTIHFLAVHQYQQCHWRKFCVTLKVCLCSHKCEQISPSLFCFMMSLKCVASVYKDMHFYSSLLHILK